MVLLLCSKYMEGEEVYSVVARRENCVEVSQFCPSNVASKRDMF